MLKIVICEDNIQYRNTLSEYVESILSANCIPGKLVLVCENASQVRNFMDRQDANVFFLDIKLNSDEDGYELASKINENVRKPYIVFVTEHLEYLLLGYKVRPFDFLPKPVTKVVLESCILNIYKDYLESSEASSNDPGKLRVSTGGKIMLIKKMT
jgi:two-component system response regulator AgrA